MHAIDAAAPFLIMHYIHLTLPLPSPLGKRDGLEKDIMFLVRNSKNMFRIFFFVCVILCMRACARVLARMNV